MVERKLYKTKLCILFQRGRCPRESCTFAHGEAELRRFSGGVKRDFRGSDLRERLDRRQSPRGRSTLRRYPRGRHAFHDQRHDRGYSPSRSPGNESERRNSKRQHLNSHSDISDSVNSLDDDGDQRKKTNIYPNDDKDILEVQLKQAQLDIEMLDDHKCELEDSLKKTKEEADRLATRNEELENQLKQVHEDCKRITSKIKKFVKAQSRYASAQDELKRAQARLEKLGGQMASIIAKPIPNEEDSSIDIISDEDADNHGQLSPGIKQQNKVSPFKKRLCISHPSGEETKSANPRKQEANDRLVLQSEKSGKEAQGGSSSLSLRKKNYKHSVDLNIPAWEKLTLSAVPSQDKPKGSDLGHGLPSTGMAANVEDELVEAIEVDGKPELTDSINISTTGSVASLDPASAKHGQGSLSHLQLPANPQNAYDKYKRDDEDDEDVDVDGDEDGGVVHNGVGGIDLNAKVGVVH
ncbi:zinc finger CCCH domain-containing protein 13-like [Nymphaea colorata]|uniref:zinc finger CCCH domain-containing protein 13-like n=1 Tax=Nymphaea colorata TaxID=210225 RepID=UPI00129DE240|nr:zinc finger CCCH domain-containing protein 13-like [Nymphaea colorata]XP_049936509.1 zinc finger CCCH domain-containing protein 13-like [Nymphaea colorata]